MTALRPTISSFRGSTRALAEVYDVALLDLDGVVYLGPNAIPGAAEALAQARAKGMRLAFVTNNASRDPISVANHLVDLGVPATADDVVMSSQAAARVLNERLAPGATVLVTGTPAFRAIIEAAGFRVVDSADDHPDAVVQGFSFDLTYRDLMETALAVRAGALWVATNVDSTLPNPRGLLPGNGSLVAMVSTATGARPLVAGKPALPLHAEAVERTGARKPLVVGDRLDTDIEGANAASTDSLLVMTGVTTAAELLTAPPERRPTYLAADLAGLLQPHPEVVQDGDWLSCGDWAARNEGDRLEIKGPGVTAPDKIASDKAGSGVAGGDPIDGLRLLATLSWSVDSPLDADEAIAQLGLG